MRTLNGDKTFPQMPPSVVPPVLPPITVKVYSESKHDLPKYETSGAAGMDVRANESFMIYPGETRVVKTGLFVAIPPMLEIQVRPRSGLSLKTKLRVANAPGTIDSCYRGEIGIIIDNTGDDPVEIKDGERYAQLVLVPVFKCEWNPVESKDDLGETDRNDGGFGSTGTK